MKVFITGASGWIGTAVVGELLEAGHDVVGLARSDDSAATLTGRGVTVLRGDLVDLDAIARGAEASDAVVHLANTHDWSDVPAMNATERGAVQRIVDVLAGSDRAFLLASGVAGLTPGRPSTEADANPAIGPDSARGGAENLALDAAERGVRSIAARFAPSVHGMGDHGFVSAIAQAARRSGVSAYPGTGENAWAAVHRSDAARLVRLALESAPAGSRVHAVAEEGVSARSIAEALGAALDLPVESIPVERAVEHFGFVGMFFTMDLRATSEATRREFDWTPSGPTLLEDVAAGAYPGR